MSKFLVNYTEKIAKEEEFTGFHCKRGFFYRSEAEKWAEENIDTIYWHEIVEVDASSKKSKLIFCGEPDNDYYAKHHGVLETFHEQGMECLGLCLYEDGILGSPNPNFDVNKPEDKDNFKYYKTYSAMKNIESGAVLEIDGFKYAMVKDREFAKADAYRLSFYPVGFSREEVLILFLPENKRATLWIPKKK